MGNYTVHGNSLRKLARHNSSRSTPEAQLQRKFAWNAKLEDLTAMFVEGEDPGEQHLFTYPFRIINGLLLNADKDLRELSASCTDVTTKESLLSNSVEAGSIIISTKSGQSLNLGCEIKETVLDFML